jgi:hypothetical protein
VFPLPAAAPGVPAADGNGAGQGGGEGVARGGEEHEHGLEEVVEHLAGRGDVNRCHETWCMSMALEALAAGFAEEHSRRWRLDGVAQRLAGGVTTS